MARLIGDYKFTGTVDGLCFYKMYGEYFVRTKSSLTSKRFWKDKAFVGSRKSCNLLAISSRLTSRFYKTYPQQKRKTGLFNEMTGKVKLWLKDGKTEEEALFLLRKKYPVQQMKTYKQKNTAKKRIPFAAKKIERLFSVPTKENFSSRKQNCVLKKIRYLKE